MRMTSLLAVTCTLVAIGSTALAQETELVPTLELFLQQYEVSTSPTSYTATGVGSAMWNNWFCLTQSDSFWNPGSVTISGLDTTTYQHGWDFVTSITTNVPILAAGLYHLTISDREETFFLDYRDDSLVVGGIGVDVLIRFEGFTGTLYGRGSNPISAWDAFSSGDTIRIWKLKRGSEALPLTSRFQPTDPTNLTISNYNSHPRLEWSASEPSSAKYLVYRGITVITATPISNTCYVDTAYDIQPTGSTVYYKVRAVSGDGTKHSINYSNTVSTHAICLLKPQVESVEGIHSASVVMGTYPNPFNPQVCVRFTLIEDSYVRLCVYDMLGREVVQLVNGELKAGMHEAVWRGVNAGGAKAPSGVYIYRFEHPRGVSTGTMLFVK
jgi:hypothetical protein